MIVSVILRELVLVIPLVTFWTATEPLSQRPSKGTGCSAGTSFTMTVKLCLLCSVGLGLIMRYVTTPQCHSYSSHSCVQNDR